MKKIFITGASGFFGKALLKSLSQTNHDFECFAVYNSKKNDVFDKRITWVQADLLDKEGTQKLIERLKPSHCVHLAWHVPPQKFWNATENVDWLYASINLFQTFCQNGGETFLGAGSLAEYDLSSGVLDENKTPLSPDTIYGQCKKSLYEVIKKVRDAHYPNVGILWPRIGYFFGPGEPQGKLISKLIHHIKNNIPLNLASADFSRPYAHIKYWGNTVLPLIFNENKEDLTFNMSASKGYPLKDIATYIQSHFKDQATEINYGSYPSTPTSLYIKTNPMMEIPDTFFKDLENTWKEYNAKN